MGDGIKRASDYTNDAIAPFLRDVKKSGTWKVADRYLIASQGGISKLSRSELPRWVDEFAQRHGLTYTRHDESEWYEFKSR